MCLAAFISKRAQRKRPLRSEEFTSFTVLNPSFVQLKINNQALDAAHAPLSPGEIFKVYGSRNSIPNSKFNEFKYLTDGNKFLRFLFSSVITLSVLIRL